MQGRDQRILKDLVISGLENVGVTSPTQVQLNLLESALYEALIKTSLPLFLLARAGISEPTPTQLHYNPQTFWAISGGASPHLLSGSYPISRA